jgi:hypothetical protein
MQEERSILWEVTLSVIVKKKSYEHVYTSEICQDTAVRIYRNKSTVNGNKGKGKGKVHPRTAHEVPEGE